MELSVDDIKERAKLLKELRTAVSELKQGNKHDTEHCNVNDVVDDINKTVNTIAKFEEEKVKLKEEKKANGFSSF